MTSHQYLQQKKRLIVALRNEDAKLTFAMKNNDQEMAQNSRGQIVRMEKQLEELENE